MDFEAIVVIQTMGVEPEDEVRVRVPSIFVGK